jgi:hypothetical protein
MAVTMIGLRPFVVLLHAPSDFPKAEQYAADVLALPAVDCGFPLTVYGALLIQLTVHWPEPEAVLGGPVWQVAVMPPKVVWKFAVVPSGTGLLNRSVMLTRTGTDTLSLSHASTLGHTVDEPTARDMLWLVGMPVDTVKEFDSVEIVVPAAVTVEAVTRTLVATVPPLTMVCTWPLASVVAVAGARVMPPTDVLSANVTAAPARGPPDVSSTLKTTVEVADPAALPTPFNVMFDGVAEMNAIEPIAACATVTVPVALRVWLLALADAVITSLPLQPVAA